MNNEARQKAATVRAAFLEWCSVVVLQINLPYSNYQLYMFKP
jgi:hypothetical protein